MQMQPQANKLTLYSACTCIHRHTCTHTQRKKKEKEKRTQYSAHFCPQPSLPLLSHFTSLWASFSSCPHKHNLPFFFSLHLHFSLFLPHICPSSHLPHPKFKLLLLSHCLPPRANTLTHHVNITSSPWPLTRFPGLSEFTGHARALIQWRRINIFSHVSLASPQWLCLEVEPRNH